MKFQFTMMDIVLLALFAIVAARLPWILLPYVVAILLFPFVLLACSITFPKQSKNNSAIVNKLAAFMVITSVILYCYTNVGYISMFQSSTLTQIGGGSLVLHWFDREVFEYRVIKIGREDECMRPPVPVIRQNSNSDGIRTLTIVVPFWLTFSAGVLYWGANLILVGNLARRERREEQ